MAIRSARVKPPAGREVEIDFGSTPTGVASFTITDGQVRPTSKVIVTQSGNAATSRDADENEFEQFVFQATPGSGSFTLIARSLDGTVTGKFKVFYEVR